MYLSDEEYKIIKQALDDADYMQKKYSETVNSLVKYIDILAEVIIDNDLCEATMERINKQTTRARLQSEINTEEQEKIFRRSKTFEESYRRIMKH